MIHGECVFSQHKFVVAVFYFYVRAIRDKQAKITRTKWWKLNGENAEVFKERAIKEDTWKVEDDANNVWDKMTTCICKVASEVCGATIGSGGEVKDTW
jgi:hypothetical protein